ncbi:MAG: tetratricopeptide repeat protein [Halobacteriota archaeon]
MKDFCDRVDLGGSTGEEINYFQAGSLLPFYELMSKDTSKLQLFYQLTDATAILDAYRMLSTPFRPTTSESEEDAHRDRYALLKARITQFEIWVKSKDIQLDKTQFERVSRKMDTHGKSLIARLIREPLQGDRLSRDLEVKLSNLSLDSFEKALHDDPNDVSALVSYGWALAKLNEVESLAKAVKSFKSALKHSKRDVGAWLGVASAFTKLGDSKSAMEAYSEASNISPRNVNVWFHRGWALAKFAQYQDAVESYSKAINIDPMNVNAWINKGWAYFRLGECNKPSEPCQSCQHALQHALESFDRVLALDPTLATAWHSRGMTLYKLARYKEALRSFSKASKINPNDPFNDFGKAVTYRAQEKESDCIMSFDKALEKANLLDATDQQVKFLCEKGDALRGFKKNTAAQECFERALELDPKNEVASQLLEDIQKKRRKESAAYTA